MIAASLRHQIGVISLRFSQPTFAEDVDCSTWSSKGSTAAVAWVSRPCETSSGVKDAHGWSPPQSLTAVLITAGAGTGICGVLSGPSPTES